MCRTSFVGLGNDAWSSEQTAPTSHSISRLYAAYLYEFMFSCSLPPAYRTNRAAGGWAAAVYFQPKVIFPAGANSVNNDERLLFVLHSSEQFYISRTDPRPSQDLKLPGRRLGSSDVLCYLFILDTVACDGTSSSSTCLMALLKILEMWA